jgi:hypothetical protein
LAVSAGKCDRLIRVRYQSRGAFAIEIIRSARSLAILGKNSNFERSSRADKN